MANYIKRIAVIKELVGGFSANGGKLSGIVKAESYAKHLRVEVSLINFASLSEGNYVFGISDGVRCIVFDEPTFDCDSDINLNSGFAFMVCFCLKGATPIASAVCGEAAQAYIILRDKMISDERFVREKGDGAAYNDEAIAEVNYYEYESDKNRKRLREAKNEEAERLLRYEDEAALDSCEGEKGGDGAYDESRGAPVNVSRETKEGLCGGCYYDKMKGEIESIMKSHEHEEMLEHVISGSAFVKIYYGENKYYVFGILTEDGAPRYICYGVPAQNYESRPSSLKNLSTYIPCGGSGYWLMYQDAQTGVSIPVTSE